MQRVLVNAMGDQCPLPVVKATRALRDMKEPGELEVHVDNEIAVENLKRMAAGNHLSVQVQQNGTADFTVVMAVTEICGDRPMEEAPLPCAPVSQKGGSFVVAVDTDIMGRGNEELGKTLMKGFLFAVSQLPQLPDTVLFYNGGAKLTVEGSVSLEDLRSMEARGVKILTCGTCLNYYGLTEQLAVGSVTNMYEIVETLAGAAKVVKP
ncbi:selenium metabolism protein YedF [Oscillibacter sp. PC13]|jgi:selenium metabolism protein YedF|uniref:sulfurtransferase-like selenium metabolism protein YedF n=1 Tax=Oscillibacter sp. PC13 TaxID=1855299 RepID=UPI0008F303FC|nr:sulfurtransferase-like selenium metabolism protein YedF [Oscillibacter sp. PC13]SFP68517.1 selenium metabolism protein YedF [Oscillibacter sp. PC13]